MDTLTFNDSARFEDRWVYLGVEQPGIWLKDLPQIISLPVAHGEGKFYAERGVLDKIESQGLVALRYVDSQGNLADYPLNPNGSINSIAGITDESGRVLGLMPHPERFMFKHHSPFWKEGKEVVSTHLGDSPFGLQFFKNAVSYFK